MISEGLPVLAIMRCKLLVKTGTGQINWPFGRHRINILNIVSLKKYSPIYKILQYLFIKSLRYRAFDDSRITVKGIPVTT